jgi:hypothetical protein
MLERNIEIRDEFAEGSQLFQLMKGKNIWIQVENAIAEISRDLFDLFQQFKKLRCTVEVDAISGGILSNEDDFVNALLDKVVDFLEKGWNGKRSLFSSNFWDNAKGTGVVAAFGDFEIFKSLVEVGQGSWGVKSLKVVEGLRLEAFEELGK